MLANVINCKSADCDVYIGRPSKWGNPFKIGRDGTRKEVIEKYREWILGTRNAPNNEIAPTLIEIQQSLAGQVLGCWCKPKACHGDVLKQFADGPGPHIVKQNWRV